MTVESTSFGLALMERNNNDMLDENLIEVRAREYSTKMSNYDTGSRRHKNRETVQLSSHRNS
jgi:hypothetical protein